MALPNPTKKTDFSNDKSSLTKKIQNLFSWNTGKSILKNAASFTKNAAIGSVKGALGEEDVYDGVKWNVSKQQPKQQESRNRRKSESSLENLFAIGQKISGQITDLNNSITSNFRALNEVATKSSTTLDSLLEITKNKDFNKDESVDHYQENNKIEENNGIKVDKFSEESLKQLSLLLKELPEAKNKDGMSIGSLLASAGALFAGKKGIDLAKEKIEEKFPKDKSERAKVQPRDETGKFVKNATSDAEVAVEKAPSFLSRTLKATGEGVASIGSKAKAGFTALGKPAEALTKVGGKLLRPAAGILGDAMVPLAAGLDVFDRYKKGQNAKQIAIGTTASTGGMMAGMEGGAIAGAELGGGIGSLFGGVGAAPGAAIGAIGGGLAGAVGGSKLGGWIADKFTGANKIAPKSIAPTSQTKDLVSLQKSVETKKQMTSNAPPTVISAPTVNNVKVNNSQTALSSSGSGPSDRGSLDLSKY